MSAALDRRVTILESDIGRVKGDHRRLADSMSKMQTTLDQNTAMTKDLHEIIVNFRGFSKVVKVFGRYVALPLVFVSGLVFAAFHHGRFPEWWAEFVKFFA